MNEEEKYLENLNSTLKLISETIDNHTNKINSLLDIISRQIKLNEEQNKIVEKLILKINTLEFIHLKNIEKITERMKIIETNNNNNNRIYG